MRRQVTRGLIQIQAVCICHFGCERRAEGQSFRIIADKYRAEDDFHSGIMGNQPMLQVYVGDQSVTVNGKVICNDDEIL